MLIARFARAVVAALGLLLLVSPAMASESSAFSSSSVRAETSGMKTLIADGAARSAAFRMLISTIEQSDLVVYVRCRLFPERELRGRLGLMSAAGGRRYAVVEISCYQPYSAQLATLAHELQHAVEVASAPWVVDTQTFEKLYAATGELVRSDPRTKAYETSAAVDQARRVHLELLEAGKGRPPERTVDGRSSLRE